MAERLGLCLNEHSFIHSINQHILGTTVRVSQRDADTKAHSRGVGKTDARQIIIGEREHLRNGVE